MKVREFIEKFMGRQVEFNQEFHRTVLKGPLGCYNAQSWKASSCARRVGWVIGMRWLATGHTESDYDYGNTFVSEGPRIPCYLVVTWPTHKPYRVPPEAVTVLEEPEEVHFMSEDERQILSEQSKSWARDERGRFIEEPTTQLPSRSKL